MLFGENIFLKYEYQQLTTTITAGLSSYSISLLRGNLKKFS